MDDLARSLLHRLPLAEAVLWVWTWITSEAHLQSLFARFRGRSYEKAISFSVMVHLIADALLHYGGSGRQSFEHAEESNTLPASIQAAYGKLRRLPIPLSMGFLAECTQQLVQLFPPVQATSLPTSLRDLEVIVLDGKAIKRVAKRLKVLRGARGGVLGGRALVALQLKNGLAVAMHAHPDGEANDARFVPWLCPQVRTRVPGPRLWLADRQFCTLQHMEEFVADGDHLLVRYHKNVSFQRDQDRPICCGHDRNGRSYVEEWGWLGRAAHKQRRYVRRITLERPGQEAIIVVTDLLDAKKYPAADLLELYLGRWGIERMFQQVTEVFGLEGLIGSTPEATIFQFAFCLLLYNIIQVVRAYAAQAGQRQVAEVSTEKLFGDATRQLIAWNELVSPATTFACFAEPPPLAVVRRRLQALLKASWTERWIKAPAQKRQATTIRGTRSHGSVFRIIQEHKQRQRASQKSGP